MHSEDHITIRSLGYYLLTSIHGYGILILIRSDIESSPACKSLFTESGLVYEFPNSQVSRPIPNLSLLAIAFTSISIRRNNISRHSTNTRRILPPDHHPLWLNKLLIRSETSSMAKLYMIPPVDLPDQQLTEAPL